MAIDFVGLGYGVRISLKADGSPDWRGAPRQDVLNLAEALVAGMDERKREFVRNWIVLVNKEAEADRLEQRVDATIAPHMKLLDKLDDNLRGPTKSAVRSKIQ